MTYGVGTDVVSVARCAEKLERNPGMYDRVCAPGEKRPGSPREFARIFAIKESCIKASGGEITLTDVSVSGSGLGAVEVNWCSDKTLSFQVSVSYSEDMVVAVALCFKKNSL